MLDEEKIITDADEKLNNDDAAYVPDENKTKKISKSKTASKRQGKKKTDNPSENEPAPVEESDKADKAYNDDNIIDAPSLDSLLFDDDAPPSEKKEEENGGFEEFLADYKNVIKNTLSRAKGTFAKDGASEESAEAEENQSTIIIDDDDTPQFSLDIGENSLPVEEEDYINLTESKNTYNPEKPRFIDNVFDLLELFVFTLAAVLIITTFFFKHTIVDGPSMMNTLHDEEHLIISDLFYTPKRGDIIVFSDYSAGQKSPFVKRVIGIAGDTVTVDSNGKVTVNGEAIDEEYVFIDGHIPYDGKTVTVPEGEVFVLGDHRNNSYDSAQFPHDTIKVDSILGKVLFRIFPFDKFGLVD